MYGQFPGDMPLILAIPHLKRGKIPFLGQKDAERPPEVFDPAVRQLLPLEPQFEQLGIVESNAVEVHIHRLRRKLGAYAIRTVRGVGYMIAKAP